MKKYNIEGGIDFFNELYKSLDIEENEFKTEEDNNLCLITKQPLEDKYINMNCGHKFNYLPLFLDIKNHKQKFNNMEGGTSHLNNDEIRCPYCRKKQKGVLPYYEELGLMKINGVNFIDINIPTYKLPSSYICCQYLKPNPSYDPSGNEPVETNNSNHGNCKFLKCFGMGTQINYSDSKGLINHNFGDDKFYCYSHKKELIKIYKKEKNDKEKEEAKKAKEQAKEAVKKAKEEEKKNKQAEKEQLKQVKKQIKNIENLSKSIINIDNENTIIGTINILEKELTQKCSVILKTGQNKGKICGCKTIKENLCSRHYNLNNTKKDDK